MISVLKRRKEILYLSIFQQTKHEHLFFGCIGLKFFIQSISSSKRKIRHTEENEYSNKQTVNGRDFKGIHSTFNVK